MNGCPDNRLRAVVKLLMVLILLAGILPSPNVRAAEALPSAPKVLLVYDSLAKGTALEGNIETMQRVLASFGAMVRLLPVEQYKTGTMQGYAYVIGVRNSSDPTMAPPEYERELQQFSGGYLHIGLSPPSFVQAKLGLQLASAESQTWTLALGQLTQNAIRVGKLPIIVQHSGTASGGQWTSTANPNWISPYAVRSDRLAYASYMAGGNLSETAIAQVVREWMGVTSESRTYLLFKEVYPFSDLRLLERLADQCYSAGIPFIVSVRPVFHNLDYPAMVRYLETLKYVQFRNGSILVNAPVVASTISQDTQSLKPLMNAFLNRLAEYGIAPLGMGAELYWAYDQVYAKDGMGFFDSVVLFPNRQLMHRAQLDTSQPFASALYSLPLSQLEEYDRTGKVMQPFPTDTALTLDMYESETELLTSLQKLVRSWITFAEYKEMPHAVRTELNTIVSDKGALVLNGVTVGLDDKLMEVSDEYAYVQEREAAFARLFNFQNTVFIAIILFTLAVFGVFFLIGYRLYKRKYYK
ncbi:hypothetical protein [Paenibacillus koleovorans]|uniref:hypothetical protein n=1 Tax=Paenibacillus koleovorans TaxID=121608 RepID=UPI000FDAFA00|nr:hypothetical protein [Paenibacillus koleovorans]